MLGRAVLTLELFVTMSPLLTYMRPECSFVDNTDSSTPTLYSVECLLYLCRLANQTSA